jgi:antitoxin component of MazEF toxin-antitoxin module
MAIQTLKRWGNSLAVRIPANVANEVAFSEGQEVDVQVQDGQVMVRPHTSIRTTGLGNRWTRRPDAIRQTVMNYAERYPGSWRHYQALHRAG